MYDTTTPVKSNGTPPVPIYHLGCGEADDLAAAAAELRSRCSLTRDPERWVIEAQVLAARLPDALRRRLREFVRLSDPSGAMLVRGVPIEPVPRTPSRAAEAMGVTLDAAACYSILLAAIGEQIGYKPELGGRLIQDVLPERRHESDQISTGSKVDLLMHVEMAFSPFRPDFVCLLCVRQDHDAVAGTTLSPVESIVHRLDRDVVAVLRQPRFRTKVDMSFLSEEQRAAGVKIWIPVCALEESTARLVPRVDLAEIEALPGDAEAADALKAFGVAVEAVSLEVRLRAGDLLITDNMRALHGRTRYVPKYDGTDRWLMRAFVVRDLRRSEAVRPNDERIVSPDYSDAIEVADRRVHGGRGY